MAILKRTLTGEFDAVLEKVKTAVMDCGETVSFEHGADYATPTGRCSVMVFERYSMLGGNRVSMNITLFQSGENIELCAITSGGSQAMFWKITPLGEESFLEKLERRL